MEYNLSFFHVAYLDLSFSKLRNKCYDPASPSICFEHLTLAKLQVSKSKLVKTCFPLSSQQKTNMLCEKAVEVGLKLSINYLLNM